MSPAHALYTYTQHLYFSQTMHISLVGGGASVLGGDVWVNDPLLVELVELLRRFVSEPLCRDICHALFDGGHDGDCFSVGKERKQQSPGDSEEKKVSNE